MTPLRALVHAHYFQVPFLSFKATLFSLSASIFPKVGLSRCDTDTDIGEKMNIE